MKTYMNIRYYLLVVILLVAGSDRLRADDNDARFMWETDFTMEFHNYGGNFNMGITVLPLQWLGATAEVGVATDCAGVSNFLKVAAASAMQTVEPEFALSYSETSFVMRYAALLQSPALWTSHTGDSRLTARVEPGVLLAFPANKKMTIDGMRYANRGGRCAFWHLKAGLSLQLYRVAVSAGYAVTDYDLYACYRNIRVNGKRYFEDSPAVNHGFYFSVGYKF